MGLVCSFHNAKKGVSFDALLLSLPQSLWLTSSSEGTFLTGSIVEVRSYEEEDYGRAGRYRRGVAIALLAAAGIALFAVRKSTTRR